MSVVPRVVPAAQQRSLFWAELEGSAAASNVPLRWWPFVQLCRPRVPGVRTSHTRPGKGTHGLGSVHAGRNTCRWSVDGRGRRGGLMGRARQCCPAHPARRHAANGRQLRPKRFSRARKQRSTGAPTVSPAQQRRLRRAELGSSAAARTIPSRWQLRAQRRPGDPGVRVSHSRPGGGTHGVGSVHTGPDTGRFSANNRSRQGSHGGRARR